ncbi:oxysterol-binding protein 1 isoform X2 [Zootermopsis nevadensis]|uniref:Oxysterol-binding protein 1 n=1 Tax=Zootermopsis nevadensis TaxID=136037 RepID=A0A067QTR4_ZOONE|nr:oxysterol-binding protein 1 isoform X2 [Zootermopsis nevadensis]KDR07319.1 Oxysterol-binding protein 1 [Zootermopsis nevadensis]
MTEGKVSANEAEMKGWLFKWTNYLKGYQRRWFVLSNGLLSYYRNQAEMAHTCRGTISLHGALINTEDSCTFVISNGGTQTFHMKAANEVERQRWITALELAKTKATRPVESEEEEEEYDESMASQKNEVQNVIKSLVSRLEDLQTCSDLIAKHGAALQRSLSELESLDTAQDIPTKLKSVNERATLFRITSNAMMNTCSDYLDLAQTHGRKWQRMLQHERDQRLRLEDMVEQLARQLGGLEQAAKEHSIPVRDRSNVSHSSPSDEDDENEFYDARDEASNQDTEANFILKIPLGHRRTSSGSSDPRLHLQDGHDEASGSSSEVDDATETKVLVISSSDPAAACDNLISKSNLLSQQGSNGRQRTSAISQPSSVSPALSTSDSKRLRRTRVPDKPNYPLNLWSIMKNCIGKELSKIPMPVNFSEPLSMLQRLIEDYEYADILDMASLCSDSCEQMAYVAAFTVSSYATTSNRTGKPFNPLLGETYECDRMDDLGWRAISEQVSHHPPMLAQYCEGRDWRCWQEFTMASKFRGKYLQVIPLGMAHLEFNSGNHYTWRKVTTTVHNIIVGKLWVDQHGDMDIVNHKDGVKCHLKYIPYSYFTRDVQRKVKGCVMDSDGNVRWVVSGMWDNKIDIAPVISTERASSDNPVFKTGAYTTVWKRKSPPPDSDRYYNFTELACQLNEPEPGVAPSDTRNRPDQRLMENGLWDEANIEKVRLEEKQRAARKVREAEAEKAAAEGRPYPPYEPVWFKKEKEPWTGSVIHMYQGKYWECKEHQDWSVCPDIY